MLEKDGKMLEKDGTRRKKTLQTAGFFMFRDLIFRWPPSRDAKGGAASGCRSGTCQADAEGSEERESFWSLSKPPGR